MNYCLLPARLPVNNVGLAYKASNNTGRVSYEDGCYTCLAKHQFTGHVELIVLCGWLCGTSQVETAVLSRLILPGKTKLFILLMHLLKLLMTLK